MHTVHLGSLSICRAQAARDKQGGSTAPHSVVKAINTKQPAAAVRNEVTELRAENARLMAALAAAEARAVPEGPVASLTGLGLEIAAKAGKYGAITRGREQRPVRAPHRRHARRRHGAADGA